MIADDEVQLFDNGGPNDAHAEPSIAAAQAGKHVLCEKPLGRTAEESKEMLDAVQKAGVKHMVAFNYRFVPAIRQIRKLIDSGALGQIYHFRATYLQEWIMPHYDTPMIWRLQKALAGSGALGDLGAHIIDMGRYPAGRREQRQRHDQDLHQGAARAGRERHGRGDGGRCVCGACWNSRTARWARWRRRASAAGRKNALGFEINGEKGSIRFDLERLNELQVFWNDDEPKETRGFHNVMVSEPYHPWWENWWPQGHMIGWEHTFVHEITHLLDCIVNDKDVAPIGADFEDGYRCAVICDAILESAETKRQVDCKY